MKIKMISSALALVALFVFAFAQDAQAYNCPYTGGDGKIIVDFSTGYDNGILKSQQTPWDGPATITKNQSIPAGNYKVSLFGWDDAGSYDRVPMSAQNREYYHVEFKNGGSVIAKSGRTTDLQDNVAYAEWGGVVNNSLTVPSGVNVVEARHSAYVDNSTPNSLHASCMLLERINPPVNGECGSSHNQTVSSKPTSGLCNSGNASSVSGGASGPWSWSCDGYHAGSSASCNAQPQGPICGNDIKESGEQCDDGNTTSGDGCSASCKNESAQITIIKEADAGGDTQEVTKGGSATFKIRVTNTGTVTLKNVVVSDPNAPACNRSAGQTQGMYSGTVFAPSDHFEYSCSVANVATGFTNVAAVSGDPMGGGSKVTANDPSQVTVLGGPAIKIVINDADNGDDHQTVDKDGLATFTVKVTNTGKEALKDVVITNDLAPGCNRNATQTKTMYKSDSLAPGQSFTYTCKSKPVTKSFKDTIKVTGVGVTSQERVNSDDPTYVDVKGKPPVTPEPPEPEGENPDCDGSIGNTIWHDKNANGKQDANEPGIPGVRVWLYKGNKVFKDTTNDRGRYKFKNLCSGTFRLVVKSEDINSLYQTYDPDGKLDHRTKIRLKGDDDHHTKADFGYRGAVAPATGPGAVLAIIFAALATGGILYFYRRRKAEELAV